MLNYLSNGFANQIFTNEYGVKLVETIAPNKVATQKLPAVIKAPFKSLK